MRTQRPYGALSAPMLAAATLTVVIVAAAAAEARWDAASPAPVAVTEDGLPGKGLPPSPGPTDPNEPAMLSITAGSHGSAIAGPSSSMS